jgi:hypothetical protein
VSLHREVIEFERREVREAMCFCVAPNQFHRVQFRSVGRKQFGAYAMAILGEPAFDRFADVSLEPIPDQRDGHAQSAAQLLEEVQNVLAIEACFRSDAEIGAHPTASRRDDQSADDRELASGAAALHEHRSLAARCPAALHQWPHQEAGFIYEDDRRTLAAGVFFTRGQSSRTQRRISGSSRSAARRVGFWGLQPKSCSNRPR